MLLIKELRDEIAVFVAKDKVSSETQTESEFQDYHCKDCIYVASCMEELDWHAGDAYNQDDPEESEEFILHPYSCNICAKRNANQGDLMSHRKNKHPEFIRTCKFFIKGKCDFPASVC